MWQRARRGTLAAAADRPWARWLATLALRRIARGTWTMEHIAPEVVAVVAAALLLHLVPRAWETRAREAFVRTPAPVQGLVLAAFAVALHLAAGAKPAPFVYGPF
jgi:alginate O-acetyltransferase complex protein AlgI